MMLLWSSTIVVGLLVLVYVMIAGVPKPAVARGGTEVANPRLLLPCLGAACTTVGIAGYLTQRSTLFHGAYRAVLLLAVAGVAMWAARWVVVAAFASPSSDPEDDPQYRFQGHIAHVTEAITSARQGRVVFEIDGNRYDLSARSIDSASIPATTEVVIERIDDDVAIVELWATVEQRL